MTLIRCSLACYSFFTFRYFFVFFFFLFRAFHFTCRFEKKNNMPIGKSEIVLKVQKCIPSRVGVRPDEKAVHRNFSELTVRAISQVIKLYIPPPRDHKHGCDWMRCCLECVVFLQLWWWCVANMALSPWGASVGMLTYSQGYSISLRLSSYVLVLNSVMHSALSDPVVSHTNRQVWKLSWVGILLVDFQMTF